MFICFDEAFAHRNHILTRNHLHISLLLRHSQTISMGIRLLCQFDCRLLATKALLLCTYLLYRAEPRAEQAVTSSQEFDMVMEFHA